MAVTDRPDGTSLSRTEPAGATEDSKEAAAYQPPAGEGVAVERDDAGLPVHRGWAPAGPRRRWMEPFILVLLAEGPTHGYGIVGDLEAMGVSPGLLDFAAVYRTLRDLEGSGHVTSSWSAETSGPQRRDYALTPSGYAMLDEWSAVMHERGRLIGEFDARYLAAVAIRRRRDKPGA